MPAPGLILSLTFHSSDLPLEGWQAAMHLNGSICPLGGVWESEQRSFQHLYAPVPFGAAPEEMYLRGKCASWSTVGHWRRSPHLHQSLGSHTLAQMSWEQWNILFSSFLTNRLLQLAFPPFRAMSNNEHPKVRIMGLTALVVKVTLLSDCCHFVCLMGEMLAVLLVGVRESRLLLPRSTSN